jgi:NAD(P)H-hydrate epimerase
MSRLTGLSVTEVQKDRVGVARAFAERYGVFVVLKGQRSLIACPDERVLVNPSGTPGMATGGSGDILTGLIAGLLAQFPDTDPSVVIAGAVYLHGLAGEKAAQKFGEKSMLATDMLGALPEAIRVLDVSSCD